MPYFPERIEHSHKYEDDYYIFKHIKLTRDISIKMPSKLLSENEMWGLGVVQSQGWEHYAILPTEPHILLLRRKKIF